MRFRIYYVGYGIRCPYGTFTAKKSRSPVSSTFKEIQGGTVKKLELPNTPSGSPVIQTKQHGQGRRTLLEIMQDTSGLLRALSIPTAARCSDWLSIAFSCSRPFVPKGCFLSQKCHSYCAYPNSRNLTWLAAHQSI